MTKPLAICIVATLLLSACTQKSETVTITDRAGNTIALPGERNRIISTAPSNTEILLGLGLGEKIIAADEFSAVLTGVPADIALIDFSYPDGELIVALDPDLIIAAGHNQTVSGEDPFALMKEVGIPVIYLPISKTIDGIYADIRFIGGLFGVEDRAEDMVREMKATVDGIAEIGASITTKRSVYFEMAYPPYMVTIGRDNYITEMINTVGAYNVFADRPDWFTPGVEAIIDRNPDVILIMTLFDGDIVAELRNRPGFEHIAAVKNGAMYLIDVNSVSRPSQHVVLALEQMAHAVYPEAYENYR
ncbi:putative ABC transporter substrate-binding lipoprotein YvrC [Spirochaetia bacterium]|nr:putative ABC transporter substrate-binding lipoprotein YvrC [Spirochaetia bacterium]